MDGSIGGGVVKGGAGGTVAAGASGDEVTREAYNAKRKV